MAFATGKRLGSYEIVGALGSGGMGEVYRAYDSKLKRDVAIKVLPEEFARDVERISRFQREAQVLASLKHPHIAAIHDLAEFDGSQFLVLELVEGETLAERLTRGPMPVEDALDAAAQIAQALEAAHAKGIVHRDLKPGNIMITADETVKVLDFGLAKIRAAEDAAGGLSNSPTLMTATTPGIILGTAAYMSPEQAKGKETDRATDVWSFGCVLYEMFTGRAAFEGETIAEVLGGVFKSEPDWSLLPAAVSVSVRRLLRRCLRKDRKLRLRDIGDAYLEINEAGDDATQAPAAESKTRSHIWILVSMLLFLVLIVGAVGLSDFRAKIQLPEQRFQI